MNSLSSVYRKADSITRDVRSKIIDGRYAPGARLPTRDELTVQYGVSKVTVQRALETLAGEGFVVAEGRRGTFVAPNCPHLTSYALLFPKPMKMKHPNQMWRSLEREAMAIQGDKQITCYHGFEGRAGFHQYDRLLEDVMANRLAGLIFASAPFMLEGTPLLEQSGVPRAAVMSGGTVVGIPAITFDTAGLQERCLAYLAAHGRRRPAVLVAPLIRDNFTVQLQQQAERFGMTIPYQWIQSVSIDQAFWAERLVRLLMDRPRAERPDSLLICDDNLFDAATRGLIAAGVKVPDELLIVAECNFPWPTEGRLPAHRIGFSATECLETCMRVIDLQRSGEPVPRVTLLPSYDESEAAVMLSTRSSAAHAAARSG